MAKSLSSRVKQGKLMHQVKRIPEGPELFEQLLLTRVIAIIAGQPESRQLPPRERVQSLLTNDEIDMAIENAGYWAGPPHQRKWRKSYADRGKWL
jgi:hypothetical protein